MSTFTRKIATVLAALTISLGVVSVAAPAHADTSWGMRSLPGGAK